MRTSLVGGNNVVPVTTLRELFAYNYWARDRQIEACAALSQEQFERAMGNSFSSVRDTLAHLVGVEWLWLERWQGRSPRALPAVEEFPNLETIAERWRAVEQGVTEYIAGLDEDALARPLTYRNMNGETWTYPLWRALLHLVNHQTYHRGQVTTLLRQLGVRPAQVDLLVADDMGLFDTGACR
jgi:uncharacterized damage-inducible protein DinB